MFVPESELNKGVGIAWLTLCALAVGLVAASVWVGDRLAHKVVGAAKSFAAGGRARSATGNWASGCSRAARASWSRPARRSTRWPSGC